MDLDYDYDYQGNVTEWKNGSSHLYYSYDGLDRLKIEDDNADLLSPVAEYFYNDGGVDIVDIGNRIGIDYNGDGDYTDPGDKEYFYTDTDNKMRLTEIEDGTTSEWDFTYDANGNMIQKDNSEGDDDEYWFYEYDEKNRLIKVILSDDSTKGDGDDVTKGEYLYDSGGLRIKKIENSKTTIYIYSGQSILFEETFNTEDQDELDNSDYYESREYNVELTGLKVAKYKGMYSHPNWSYVLEFHLLDHLGSRQVVTDDDGDIITDGDIEYGTFGEYVDGVEGEYSYTGKKRDSATGLSYFNARYYDASIGRFITVDPIKSGLNWYVYCENNPLRYVDQNGLNPVDQLHAYFLFLVQYKTMLDENWIGNDHYHHAMANSRVARGFHDGDYKAALKISLAREISDHKQGDTLGDCIEDMIANAHGRNIDRTKWMYIADMEYHNSKYDVRAGGSRARIPDEYAHILSLFGYKLSQTHLPENEFVSILSLIDALETLKATDYIAYRNHLDYVTQFATDYYINKHNYNPDSHPGQSPPYTSPYGDPDHIPGRCY